MDDDGRRDLRSYIPGFAVIVVLAGALALAPSLVPAPLRDAIGFGRDRLAPQVDAPGGGTYAFLSHQDGNEDDPVGYDPCRPVRIVVNPLGAPSGHLALVQEALATVSRATGLRLEYVGTSEARPRWERRYVPALLGEPRRTPVLISWATADEVPQLEGRVAGVAGSAAVSVRGGRFRYVTGGVTLDRDVFRRLARTVEGRREARAILLHELGHLVGLAHVDDRDELMNADNLGLLDFGPGDRTGLAKVGATPCG